MRSKRLVQAALLGAALGAIPSQLSAQSYTWITPSNASFSVGPWSPSTPSWGGATSVALVFTNITSAPYTATNDLGAPFALNAATFSGSDNRSITIANAVGNELSFVKNGAVDPKLFVGSVSTTIAGRMNIGTTTTINSLNGGGALNLTGVITGPGGLSLAGSNNVLISNANTTTGTATINGGTVSIANNFAFGTGTIVFNNGVVRSPNPGATLPNVVTLNNPLLVTGTLTYNAAPLADLALNNPIAAPFGGKATVNVFGGGALRLNAPSNSFNNGTINLNSGTTAFNSRLIFSGVGDATINVSGPGGGELIYTGLNGLLFGNLNVANTATAFVAPGTDVSSLSTSNLLGAGTIVLGLFSNFGTISLNGSANTNAGPISFFSGVTTFNSDTKLGNASTLLFDGGTVMPTAAVTTSKPIVLADNTAVNGNSSSNPTTFNNGVALDPAAIGDALIKTGNQQLVIKGTSSARFVVNEANLTMNGSLNYSGANPAITVNAGGTFTLDNATTNVATPRLVNNPRIAMNGGVFETLNFGSNSINETLGTLSVSANTRNVLSLGSNTTFTFAGLSKQPGSLLIYNGASFGSVGSGRVFYPNAPSGSLLVGGGGAAGTPTISILAGTLVNRVVTETDAFATYDASGVRQLSPGEYASSITSGDTTLNNASLNVATGINSPTTINSLTLTGSAGVSGATTLNVNSGMIIAKPSGVQNNDISVSTLALGAGILDSSRTLNPSLTISSIVTGSSLLISGHVKLSGSNTYTGPTVIGDGSLDNGASEVIPDNSTVYVNGNTTWNLNEFTETVSAIGQQNVANLGYTRGTIDLGNGTLIVGANNASSDYAGSVTGSGRVIKIGSGSLNLSGGGAFGGGLLIQQGIVRVAPLFVATSPTGDPNDFAGAVLSTDSADNILGTGSIQLSPLNNTTAELRLGRNITSLSRTIFVGGSGTIILSTDADPNRGTLAEKGPTISSPITLQSNLQLSISSGLLNGPISGAGSLTISNLGAGQPLPIVRISNASSSFNGATIVKSGSLYIEKDVPASSNSPLGSGTQSLVLGTAQTDAYAEVAGSRTSSGFLTIARPIVTTAGLPGQTLALAGRVPSDSTVIFSGTITLGAAPLRLFSAQNPGTIAAGTLSLTGQVTGTGSLSIGGGFVNSSVQIANSSNNYTGGTILTDGTLLLAASSVGGSGPIGTGSLNIAGASLPPALRAISGPQSILNPVFLNSNVNITGIFTIDALNLGAGERVVNVATSLSAFTVNGIVSGSSALCKDGAGAMILNSVNTITGPTSVFAGTLQFGASQNLSSLNIGGVSQATLLASGDKVLRTNVLNIASTGVFDLNDNKAIVDYTGPTPLANIRQLIAMAYNNGSWTGAGLTSSTARTVAASLSPNRTAVGFAEASALGVTTFAGQSVDATSILMRYTYSGDANLDGTVNALDFNAVASNFGIANRTWYQGDFNYDGQVDNLDFTMLANNFNLAMPAPPAAIGSLVPEPSLIVGLLVLLPIRRRRAAL